MGTKNGIIRNLIPRRSMKKTLRLTLLFSFAVFLQVLFVSAAGPAGTFKTVEGNVTVLRGGKIIGEVEKSPLFVGDTVRTGKKPAFALLRFINGTEIEIGAKSRFVVTEFSIRRKKRGFIFELLEGFIKGKVPVQRSGRGAETEFKTPTAVIGIRGTLFVIEAKPKKTLLYCFKGLTEVRSLGFPKQKVVVPAGFFSEVRKGALPTPPKRIQKPKYKEFGFSGEKIVFEQSETSPEPPRITLPPPSSPSPVPTSPPTAPTTPPSTTTTTTTGGP